MGDHRARPPGSQTSAFSISRAQADRKPSGAVGDSLCSENGNTLAGFAPGNGLWVRHELLEATARLASSRRVGRHPPDLAQQAAPGREDRLVTRGRGQFQCARRFWGAQTGPNPTDRGKNGSKHHILVDGHGTPLAKALTGANVHDVTQLIPLVDAIPPVTGKPGRPRRRPHSLWADKAYDSRAHRLALSQRGIEPVIPKRGTGRAEGLGPVRWVVERTISWLHQFRRLRVRYERRPDIHEAILTLGCIVICHRTLQHSFC